MLYGYPLCGFCCNLVLIATGSFLCGIIPQSPWLWASTLTTSCKLLYRWQAKQLLPILPTRKNFHLSQHMIPEKDFKIMALWNIKLFSCLTFSLLLPSLWLSRPLLLLLLLQSLLLLLCTTLGDFTPLGTPPLSHSTVHCGPWPGIGLALLPVSCP